MPIFVWSDKTTIQRSEPHGAVCMKILLERDDNGEFSMILLCDTFLNAPFMVYQSCSL